MAKHGPRVLAALRKMIVNGELEPGARLTELSISKRMGVSRTPIRLAFRILEQEGLLQKTGARGYVARRVDSKEIAGAIEVRGVLEGLAARLLTEAGLSRSVRNTLRTCLDDGDELFKGTSLSDDDLVSYGEFNSLFHRTIIDASDNAAISIALSRNDHLPFASVESIAADRGAPADEFKRFHFAHMQHHLLVDAMESGESARAESIMREHANAAIRYAEVFGSLTFDEALSLVSAA
jgi:GntR family transcriptional regulator of vanillate catabolism